jgi:hypothetical protein
MRSRIPLYKLTLLRNATLDLTADFTDVIVLIREIRGRFPFNVRRRPSAFTGGSFLKSSKLEG